MRYAGRFLAGALSLGLAACTHNDFTPNVIQLTPNGSSSSPASEPITKSFTLVAVEDGYTGQFTADTIKGECWVVQAPVSTGGAWTVVPQGTTCSKLDTEQIQVKDQKGNLASTYIRSTNGGSAGATGVASTLAHHRTFHYEKREQLFDVPRGVTRITVVAHGGNGAGSHGGYGGRVYAILPVVSGERLTVVVGGNGDGWRGGYNGGGGGSGFGGGGSTDVRENGDRLAERILVAGGGGGAGLQDGRSKGYSGGGKGGGSTGGDGVDGCCGYGSMPLAGGGGLGGTQSSGGAGGSGGYGGEGSGNPGSPGRLLSGGAGGTGCYSQSCVYGGSGGGGGGGFYGGGGGSSYVEPSAIKYRDWRGWKAPGGIVIISWR